MSAIVSDAFAWINARGRAAYAYVGNNWPDDSLLACLGEFTDSPLFRPASEVDRHEFIDAPHVIDIHRLPEDLRKLAVFLRLDGLCAEVMASPDAPLVWH